MPSRRHFLESNLAAIAALAFTGRSNPLAADELPAPGTSEDLRVNAMLERAFQSALDASPETMTNLGVDSGSGLWARSRLDDRSVAARARFVLRQKGLLRELQSIDRRRLHGIAAVSYDSVRYQVELLAQSADRFGYGAKDNSRPYLLSQLNGAYQSIPDFLASRHTIEVRDDAQAYLSRLAAFATALDQETEAAQGDAARAVIPPDFIIDKTLLQLKALRDTPAAQSTLVASLSRRAVEKKISGDFNLRATQLVEGPLRAALNRQIALLEAWRPKAVHEAGVSRLPDGEAYYQFATKLHTTTNISPAEIHRLGLEQVTEISSRMDALLRAQGAAIGTVAQRLTALAREPRFLYPNTDAGRQELLDDLNGRMQLIQSKLAAHFQTLPKGRLEVRRVPQAVEAGGPRGYYFAGTLDGARPSAYYLNLRDTAEWPKFQLPTSAYHEGSPGHHVQVALALETPNVPKLLKTLYFLGYSEGWALYAEQLADEMGAYEDDPFGRIGYLQSLLFRAARLVADSGLHAQRWTLERAVRYIVDCTGAPESRITTEVERYCAWPGQACSYKIGHTRWVALRERARQRLGSKFDIRQFHYAGLSWGPMPLDVLERVIDNWIAAGGSAS